MKQVASAGAARDTTSAGRRQRAETWLPFWTGPTDTDVLPQSLDVADPDGGSTDNYLPLFASLIGESP